MLFIIGIYAIYDSYLVYEHANDTSILAYKPGYKQTEATKPIVGTMVAWLTIDDTTIDYPVMQGETNDEYLNKDPFGDYSLSGSIFLDSRNASDFSDDYSLIYGHHMENNLMFGILDNYVELDFFNHHRTGTLIVNDISYQIQFFAVLEAEATNEAIFSPTEISKDVTLEYIRQNALFFDDTVNCVESPILALSTCKYPNTIERTIVVGTLKKTDILH